MITVELTLADAEHAARWHESQSGWWHTEATEDPDPAMRAAMFLLADRHARIAQAMRLAARAVRT